MKIGLPAALGLIFLLTCAALYTRQSALADRLEALERRSAAAPRTVVVPPPALPRADEEHRPSPRVEAPRQAVAGPAPAAPPSGDVLREAVAREVERQMEARRPSIATFSSPEDPLAMLEKELGLSPAQKIRIAELWKRREEDQRKLFEGGALKGGPGEHFKKVQELEEKYETAVNLELDFTQQERYAQLKKEGRLHNGVVFRVQVGAEK